MSHTVEYASLRSEIWKAYWRAWARPKGLWLYHVAFGFLVAFLLQSAVYRQLRVDRFLVAWALAIVACVVVLPLWPQVRFKSARRSLTIDETGFMTSIGKLSGSRSWKEVARIEDAGGDILMFGTNGNAMVVPKRAFENNEARSRFLRDARAWHSGHAV
jgi:hypothetical protein